MGRSAHPARTAVCRSARLNRPGESGDFVVDSRAAIEQANGVLILVYGISAERAFDVLVWRSQETNVKVREFARRLLAGLPGVDISGPAREAVDYLLLTLDERI